MIKLYGVPGWGSAISEVMLTLADIPYQFINVDGFDQPGPQRELLHDFVHEVGELPLGCNRVKIDIAIKLLFGAWGGDGSACLPRHLATWRLVV